jgi:hypothetical protein
MDAVRGRGFLLVPGAMLLLARGVVAGDVELAPFAAVHFGGLVGYSAAGRGFSTGSGFQYGSTVDFPVAAGWRVEALYSRQEAGPSGGSTAERFMAGIQEERDAGRSRFFGAFRLGLTRFAPAGGRHGADECFTAGLGLGLKTPLSRRLGLRAEARGFFVNVASQAGTACINGACVFGFSASGLWQGDVSAGVVMMF